MSVFCVPCAIITARNSAAVSYIADTCIDRGGSGRGGGGGGGGGAGGALGARAPHSGRIIKYSWCILRTACDL